MTYPPDASADPTPPYIARIVPELFPDDRGQAGAIHFVSVPETAEGVVGGVVAGLADHLRDHPGTVALVGNHPCLEDLHRRVIAAAPAATIERFTDHASVFLLRSRPDIRTIALVCGRTEFMIYMKSIAFATPFAGTVVVPASADAVHHGLRYEDPAPMLVCAFPCAGTNRFIPGFEYLVRRGGWRCQGYSPFMRNLHEITGRQRRGAEQPGIDEATEAVFWRARALDLHDCLMTHEWLHVGRLAELDCRVVVLMRDPRDIINSYYWHTLPEARTDAETHLAAIMHGYVRHNDREHGYAFRWPDAGSLARTYLDALAAPNAHVIRFEDMGDDDGGHFRTLLAGLGLDRRPFAPLDGAAYRHAAHLGSFEYQTGGRRRRGEDHKDRPGGEDSGISTRKGIAGDWRNSFTPAAVELFKRLTGDALLRLGYEADPDWGL